MNIAIRHQVECPHGGRVLSGAGGIVLSPGGVWRHSSIPGGVARVALLVCEQTYFGIEPGLIWGCQLHLGKYLEVDPGKGGTPVGYYAIEIIH